MIECLYFISCLFICFSNKKENSNYITGFTRRKRIRRKEAEIKIKEQEKKIRSEVKREVSYFYFEKCGI